MQLTLCSYLEMEHDGAGPALQGGKSEGDGQEEDGFNIQLRRAMC